MDAFSPANNDLDLFGAPAPEISDSPEKFIGAARERHRELTAQIVYHNQLYYNKERNEISDYDYDALKRELELLETKFPELAAKQSPTRQVGAPLPAALKKITHRSRMLSLKNSYDADDLRRFCDRVSMILREQNLPSAGFMTELKIDGLAITLIYENGELTLAATRGDGREGEIVTENIRQIPVIPAKILPTKNMPEIPPILEVRGEVYLPRENFWRLREEQEINGEPVFANPRNAAAGTLKVKDAAIVRQRGLTAFVYASPDAAALNAHSQQEILERLRELNFPVNEYFRLCENYDTVLSRRDEFDLLRHQLPYDTDGMVVKVNSVVAQNALGADTKAPVWAVAYKFMPEQAETTLLDIHWQIGKFGTLTPVAVLSPVELSGSTICSASLHNYDYLIEKDLRIGDRVIIEKAGEIIPQVVKGLPEKRTGETAIPLPPPTCPSCNATVKRADDKSAYQCTNGACPAQLRARLLHFVSRDAQNLSGFGPAVIDKLLAHNLIADLADLFYLTAEKIATALQVEATMPSVQNLVKAMEAAKTRPLADLLTALAIPHIGANFARKLAEKFLALDNLAIATAEEISALPTGETFSYRAATGGLSEVKRTLGTIAAQAVVDFFSEQRNREMMERMRAAGVNFIQPATVASKITNCGATGKSFVLTGTLPHWSRNDAKKIIENAGGKVVAAVTKSTDFVVAGEAAGSKFAKAQTLGIKIIDETAMLELCGEK